LRPSAAGNNEDLRYRVIINVMVGSFMGQRFGITSDKVIEREVRYGLLIVIGLLIFVLTFFQCWPFMGMHNNWNSDFHMSEMREKFDNGVTVTASNEYISIAKSPDDPNSKSATFTSYSTVPVDAIATYEDGRECLIYHNLQPGESFFSEFEEPVTVIFSAS
jgi:hypothetical protein